MPITKLTPENNYPYMQERLKTLKQAIPEAFEDGKINWDTLREVLEENLEDEGPEEFFGLNWPGKREARIRAATPSRATLVPAPGEGVNEDETENLFIEGDNLEVLKLLQKSYAGKVKMIYIDPPYNTGNDFIYNDNFSDPLEAYLEYTGSKGESGELLTTNTHADGRFHSRWLSMMLPRLVLARQLLNEEGVLLVSINDSEIHNLRMLLNEIFGEENFIASLIWDKGHSAQAGIFKVYHEYVLVYAKFGDNIKTPKSNDNELFIAGALKRESKRHPVQEFNFPEGVRFDAPDRFELTESWGGVEKVELISGRMVCENGKTKFPITLKAAFTQMNQMRDYFSNPNNPLYDTRGQKIIEFYFSSSGKIKIVKERSVFTPETTLSKYGTQSNASTQLAALFNLDESPIDNPKPVLLISDFINWFTKPEDIVLDFFAGSCTTSQSVFKISLETDQRKFIVVQIPERTKENSTAFKAGYKTIAEIGKERIRRTINKINKDIEITSGKLPLIEEEINNRDLGFKVYKYDRSNFKLWEPLQEENTEVLTPLFDNLSDPLLPNWKKENLLSEILLLEGFPLTSEIVYLEDLLKNQVYQVSAPDFCAHNLFICLDETIQAGTVELLTLEKEDIFVCLDSALSDEIKAIVQDKFNVHVI